LLPTRFGVEGAAVCKDFLFNGHPAARFVFTAWPSRKVDKVATKIETTHISADFRTRSDELSDLDA
jgi:hypothetical protein